MRIVIKGYKRIIDTEKERIVLLEFTEKEKEHISSMPIHGRCLCAFPSNKTREQITIFMKEAQNKLCLESYNNSIREAGDKI